ncbi:MAG: hypothetical protein QW273_04000 [Candidatus Pacearchaeota archaeon]
MEEQNYLRREEFKEILIDLKMSLNKCVFYESKFKTAFLLNYFANKSYLNFLERELLFFGEEYKNYLLNLKKTFEIIKNYKEELEL